MTSNCESKYETPPRRLRPFSFGATFSRKPTLVTSDPRGPRQSVHTRISDISSRDESLNSSRLASVSPRRDVRASSTPEARSIGSRSPTESPVVMRATFIPDGGSFGPGVGIPPLEKTSMKRQQSTVQASNDEKGDSGFDTKPQPDGRSINRPVPRIARDVLGDHFEQEFSNFSFTPTHGENTVKAFSLSTNASTNEPHQNAKDVAIPDSDTISTIAGLSSGAQLTEAVHSPSRHKCKSGDQVIAVKEAQSLGNSKLTTIMSRKPAREGFPVGSDDTPNIVVRSPVTPVIAHNKQEPKSPRAEKALRVPFLQKFRRSRIEADPVSDHDRQLHVPHGQQTIGSFFEDASSDGDDDISDNESDDWNDGKHTFLGNAQQASFRRPVLVNHRRSNSPQLGLTDILDRGPSPNRVQNVSPLSNERVSVINPALESEQDTSKEKERHTVPSGPASEKHVRSPQITKSVETLSINSVADPHKNAADVKFKTLRGPPSAPLSNKGPKNGEDPPILVNGLRSHPTNAKQKPINRQVTFPLTIQAKKDKCWQDGSIIGTPYPSGYVLNNGQNDPKQRLAENRTDLLIVLYGRNRGAPKTERVGIPTKAHEFGTSDVEKGKKISMNSDFDDSGLARSLFSAYQSMRGTWYTRLSARSVRSVRLLGYETMCELATGRATEQCLKTQADEDGLAHASLIQLYQSPKKGKGKWIWWNWARGLPQNQEGADRPNGKVALELVEGWIVKRILGALFFVGFLAILTAVLWILAGKSVNPVQIAAQVPLNITSNGPVESVSISSASAPYVTSTSRTMYPDIPAPTQVAGMASSTTVSGAPAMGVNTPAPAVARPAGAPTVVARDSQYGPYSASVSSSVPAKVTTTSSEAVTQEFVSEDTAGSRLGPGVGLGVLMVLVGWMIIGAWMAVSWAVT